MAGKWHGRVCPVCGEGTLRDGTKQLELEYRGERFVEQQLGAICDLCGDGVTYHDPEQEARWEQFRHGVEERLRRELAAIRSRLGLTQEEASRLSGGGHNAFSRYERGEAQPVAAVLNLFRLLDAHPELIEELDPTLSASSTSAREAKSEDLTHGAFVMGTMQQSRHLAWSTSRLKPPVTVKSKLTPVWRRSKHGST